MDTNDAVKASTEMWESFAKQLAEAIPHLVSSGAVHQALQFAVCAEACFFQATGECDSFGVKEAFERNAPISSA